MFTMKQVADMFGVHWRTVERWIKEGKIKSIKIGRTVRISESEVNKMKGEN